MIRKIQQLTVALLLAGLALTLTLTPTRADSPPTFVTKWGNFGENAGEFVTPAGIAVDSAGNVYVADSGNQRIQKFDGDGNFLRMWGGGVNTGAGDPDICTVDTDCQIGTSGGGAGQFGSPTGIAIDSSDNVYVAESGNHRIQKFDSNGNFLLMWGSGVNTGGGDPNICTSAVDCQAGTSGSGDGQFNTPVSVAVSSSGNVYVADNLNNRIQKFSNTGAFVTKWGAFGAPAGVAVDSSSNVYVTNPLPNVRIQKFNSDGTATLAQWGSFGINADAGEFAGPAGLTVDSSGNIYISDRVLFNRIQLFDINTDFVRMWGFGVDTGAGVFEICSASTTPCQTGISGSGDGQFNASADVAVDSAGNIYVVEESNHRVQKFEQRLLAITKTVNNDTPRSGDQITYTITVHNGGSISATNTVISDTLPAGLTFAGPVGLEGSSGTVAQNAGELPALASNVTITNGSTITITFPVTVNTVLAPNTVINNTAAVTSTEESTPQTASTLITVNAVDLEVLKIPDDLFPNPGQLITYTISVKNSGIISATNAVISDTLPDGLTFAGPVGLEGSSGTVAQDAGDLPTLASGLTIPNGSTITVTLPVTVNTGQDHGTLIFNVASVTSDEITSPEYGLGFTVVITLNDTLPPIFPSNPLITPTQGITLDTLFPLFEWYAAWDNGQVLTYLLTLSSTLDVLSAQSTSISFTTSQTSFVSPIPLSSGEYFWTVQAQDAAGNVNSPPIPSQSFTITAGSKKTYLPIIIKN